VGKNIIVMGTLDTRGEEIRYLADQIRKRGHYPKVMDVGVLGQAPFEPSIKRDEVALAAGTSLKEIISLRHEGRAMSAMASGAYRILRELYDRKEMDGVVAAGGSMSTSLALEAMRHLPLGLPKLVLSTIAFSPLVKPEYVGADMIMMLWPAGLYGLNRISRNVLRTAAGVITGAAETEVEKKGERKKTVGVTSLGTSQQKFVERLKPALEQRGYDVAVFHTLGMGGQAFEQAIRDGVIDVALDFSLVELVDEVTGGATTSGKMRLKAAAEKGIPQIVAAGAISNFFWFAGEPLPPGMEGRKHHRHNQLLTIVVASTEDKAKVGAMVAERLNQAKGPTAMIIPRKGWIEGDRDPRSPFHDPQGGEAFSRAFKEGLNSDIRVIELDAHINDPLFTETVIKLFDEIVVKE